MHDDTTTTAVTQRDMLDELACVQTSEYMVNYEKTISAVSFAARTRL